MEDKMLSIPYVVYEGEQARHERTIKRLIIILAMTVVLLFASNAIWVYMWNQFEYIDSQEEVTVDATDGIANYIGNDGTINNGTDKSEETD